MRVLITGGNGFLGSHLSELLINRGDSVSLLDLKFDFKTEKMDCTKIIGDIRDYKMVKDAVSKNDVIFHFGAVSRVIWGQSEPSLCWDTNSSGTLNVLEACRKESKDKIVFYASSREVYGESKKSLVKEDHPKNPKSVYGASKLSAELACHAYNVNFGSKIVLFRFSNVYGSEKDILDRVIPKFMIEGLKNQDITLYGGNQVLDFNFINDTIDGIYCAYKKSLQPDSEIFGMDFHFVTGRGVAIKDLAKMIIEISSSSSKIIKKESNSFDVKYFVGDPSKARKILGYKVKTKLEDGLQILKSRLESKCF